MKLSILISSTFLFATALIPTNAYADDSNLMCRRSGNDCNSNNGKISISGLSVSVKSSDRGNKNRDTEVSYNDTRDETVADTNTENDNPVDNNTADVDNNNDNNNDNIVDADNGTENDTDPVADNNSNNSPPQSNSNDIEGFDPFGGLYGPGT